MIKLDKTDLNILSALQTEGRLTNVELAEAVNLSPSPCLRRVKRLEQEGVITGYRAGINREQVGLPMTVFVDVSLANHKDQASQVFEAFVMGSSQIISCHLVSGAEDYRMEVVVADLKDYERILKQIMSLPVVDNITSNFAIRSIKAAEKLPL